MQLRSIILLVGICALAVGVGIGVIIGYFSSSRDSNPKPRPADEDIADRIMKEISRENIRDNLRYYARKPHVAGTPADREGAEDIKQAWLDQGLDSVRLVPYQVYLQHPPPPEDEENANKVQVINSSTGEVIYNTPLRADPFDEDELLQPGIPPPYMAFSGTGDVMGDLVYVHYGAEEDYELILNELDPTINFTGRIAICRQGGTSRYEKAAVAQRYGVIGVILFSDPYDYSVPQNEGLPYPNGKFLPGSATQRGALLREIGDPLTHGYPAKEFAFRISPNETDLPRIPVHPVGFHDAEKLLQAMGGASVPNYWKGGLNAHYTIGPGFTGPNQGNQVRLVVNSVSGLYTTYNTVGFLRGEIEPDRYVIIGNHRDAWGLGSIDPTSGTATLLEISRVFGMLKKEGWRPRRTLVFCSWGAEEFGMFGSVEWTEEFGNILMERTVAYVNLDIAVADTYVLYASASPNLRQVIYEATKRVPDPDPSDNRTTVYDTMLERNPDYEPDLPFINLLVDGSDDYAFEKRLGISCISGYYIYDTSTLPILFYSLYHTQYETIRLMETYIDPDYRYHQAVGRVFAEMTRILSDSVVLPFDSYGYYQEVENMFYYLGNSTQSMDIAERGVSLESLDRAIGELLENTLEFQKRVESVDTNSDLAVRQINDQMMFLSRAFLGELPDNKQDRHLLFSPRVTIPLSTEDVPYTFPGLQDALHHISDAPDQEQRWRVVEQHIAVLTHAIEAASSVLKDVTSW
ncbi:N-acetylated-alpha-linked acidic dipeptidase 2-like [Lytechinus pictus]|uniref:N-acetylated-alpha-linked acidic dipeptidase 2-like n=1 Tax=Lytechinus pictus TaxID=7653 RepID=UPI0030BA2286